MISDGKIYLVNNHVPNDLNPTGFKTQIKFRIYIFLDVIKTHEGHDICILVFFYALHFSIIV